MTGDRPVLVVQHLPHEHEGVLGEVLAASGVPTVRWRAWTEPDLPPALDDVAAMVVLGGDMNTDEGDRWPHLHVVRDLLARAVEADLPTLAICLGAQLLAEATGGSVAHGTPEIGWIPIEATPAGASDPVVGAVPSGTRFFNAHADFITAPPQAALLARSADCAVHAFRVGSALGLQYHPEIDASFVAGYVEAPGVEAYLGANGWTPEGLVHEARLRNAEHRRDGAALFTAWVRALDGTTPAAA